MAARAVSTAFSGRAFAASAADIDAWVAHAGPLDRLTYCEAPDLIRGSGAARVAELVQDGMVTPFRQRREGGGWVFLIERTRRVKRAAARPSVTVDLASDIILRALKRAANFGQRCPSDADLAKLVAGETGADFSRDQAQWRIRKLAVAGRITSRQVVEDGETWRVVSVDGKTTLRPPKEAAMAASMRGDPDLKGAE